MNLLIITPYIPYPHSEGGKVAQYGIIDFLRNRCSVTLALPCGSKDDTKNILALRKLWSNVEIKEIHLGLDKSNGSFLKSRILGVLRSFKYLGTIIKRKGKSIGSSCEFDSSYLLNISVAKNRKFIEGLDQVLKEKKFDIIQVDILDYIDLVLMLPEGTKKVFVHHEIRFQRFTTALKTLKSQLKGHEHYAIEFTKFHEINLLEKYDGIFVFSDHDKRVLTQVLTKAKVYTTPFPVLDNQFAKVVQEKVQLKKLIFLGGESHTANKDGVQWFIDEVLPLLEKRHTVPFYIVGRWEKETVKRLTTNTNIIFTGFVDQPEQLFKDSIMVVPIRIGSGIRAKVLYALAQGMPIVTTSIGHEGIEVSDKREVLIADDPETFSKKISLLLENQELASNICEKAYDFAKENYSQSVAGNIRMKCLEDILYTTT
jgi:glycosyltransferase involved in cell wall biosynthesis